MADEKAKRKIRQGGAVAQKPHAGGKKETLPGKHSAAGLRVDGVRRRARKPQDVDRVSEE